MEWVINHKKEKHRYIKEIQSNVSLQGGESACRL